MNELVEQVKARLMVQDLVAKTYRLAPQGGKLIAINPDGKAGDRKKSLTVDPRKQLWSWWSQTPAAGQKCCGGDVLDWIAFQRFGRPKVTGEQFCEVLKEACALAGVEYVEGGPASADATARQARKALEREKRQILAAYLEVAEAAWSETQFVRARQIGSSPDGRKKGEEYLTPGAIERWSLGCAPTLKQCLKGGMTEAQLRLVGLLRERSSPGPDDEPWMHFKDAIVIPWFDGGEVVYLSCRRFKDYDGSGKPLEKNKKSLSMYAPGEGGRGGVSRPAGFNLETLRSLFDAATQKGAEVKELLIVEGPLDAIACEEQGHAAIALGCTTPTAALIERLAMYPQVIKYLALDGTKDVTAVKRAQTAGAIGYYTRVCALGADLDPDDMNGEQLAGLKAAAIDVLEEWCRLVA